MDQLIHFVKSKKGAVAVRDFCVVRYWCLKQSTWRGKYRRIFCVSPSALFTQRDNEDLAVTNTYALVGDVDVESIGPGKGDEDIIIIGRADKKSKFKAIRFQCSLRASLLTDIYQCLEAARQAGNSSLAGRVLGATSQFSAAFLDGAEWRVAILRLGAYCIECHSQTTGRIVWRVEYRHMSNPGIQILASSPSSPDPEGQFAIFSKVQKVPRVCACADRSGLIKSMQEFGLVKLGIAIAVDMQARMQGKELLEACAAAEREMAVTSWEAPICEWAVSRVEIPLDAPPLVELGTPRGELHRAASSLESNPRRLVLTKGVLLERYINTYEVSGRFLLGSICALVRFIDEPQKLGIEWSDGTPPTLYATPARDSVIAAILDVSQTGASRAIPILPDLSHPGDTIIAEHGILGYHLPVKIEAELESLYVKVLGDIAKYVYTSAQDLGMLTRRNTYGEQETAGKYGDASSDDEGTPVASAVNSKDATPLSSRPSFKQINRATAKTMIGTGSPYSRYGSSELMDKLWQRIVEFNACIPYSGVSAGVVIPEAAVYAIMTLLPPPTDQSNSPPPSLGTAIQIISVLQCLQRLSASCQIVSIMLLIPSGLARVYSLLLCGNDHVATEAARLLVRLWAPAAGRNGAGPWFISRGPQSDDSEIFIANNSEENKCAISCKSVCLSPVAKKAPVLLKVLTQTPRPSPLLSMAIVESLGCLVCEPGSRSTDQQIYQKLMELSASMGQSLFGLFDHPAHVGLGRVSDGAAVIMRSVAECGAVAAAPMRDAALMEGALLHHLHSALFRKGGRSKLGKELVALWIEDHAPSISLLKRIFPKGLIQYLKQPVHMPQNVDDIPAFRGNNPLVDVDQQVAPSIITKGEDVKEVRHTSPLLSRRSSAVQPSDPHFPTEVNAGKQQEAGAYVFPPESQRVRRNSASTVSTGRIPYNSGYATQAQESTDSLKKIDNPEAVSAAQASFNGRNYAHKTHGWNWGAFWTNVDEDHCHAGLIWNEQTRAELREALESEQKDLKTGRTRVADGSGGYPCWNHVEFRVEYPTLQRNLCIGGVFVKMLLEGINNGSIERLLAPKDFFNHLYHQFLCAADNSLHLEQFANSTQTLFVDEKNAVAAFVEGDIETERELCVSAMAAVYSVHAGIIGPFDGVGHATNLMDKTLNRSLRCCLLQLIEALISPSVSDEKSGECARTNGRAFIEAGGIGLCVDVLAGAHEAREQSGPLEIKTTMITDIAHEEKRAEWYYYPEGKTLKGAPEVGPSSPSEAAEDMVETKINVDGLLGPVMKSEIKQMFSDGSIRLTTHFQSTAMRKSKPLWSIRELRWLISRRSGSKNSLGMARLALKLLEKLASLQSALEANGEVLQPLPRAHREMTSPEMLPHICQAILTSDPEIVSGTARLLRIIVEHNRLVLPRLYLTGVFFFSLAYCGSNLAEIAYLFKISHLHQFFRGEEDSSTAGMPLYKRSFLGDVLPESLLYVLETHGPETFAQTMVSDGDTPEVIWTHSMRGQRLVPQMLHHVGDFPHRLKECCHIVYEYTPLPPVGYPEFKDEIWCHRYYLRNLCDEVNFGGWEIVDHVPLLQSLLVEWRAELTKKPMSMSESEACKLLNIDLKPDEEISEEALKRAYRKMAFKYHPDKNPQGRDVFVSIQKAYERLQAGAAAGKGAQPWRILLILKAQCILFKRYSDVLQPFKYAGYSLLLDAVSLPEGDDNAHFLSPERAPQLQTAVELCWLTCVCSPLNGEELTRSAGVQILGNLLMRCLSIIPMDVAPTEPAAIILTHALRTFVGLSMFANARIEIANSPLLAADIIKSCALQRVPSSVDAALLCISQSCKSSDLQSLFLELSILGYVVPLLFNFDETERLDGNEEGLPPPFDMPGETEINIGALLLGLQKDNAKMQQRTNYHAMLAVHVLGRLCGVLSGWRATPAHQTASEAVTAVLTPALKWRISEDDPRPLLSTLNGNVKTPQIVWDGRLRAEVLKLMESQREKPDTTELVTFHFEALEGELVIAGVFVRIYISQPNFQLSGPFEFAKGLVKFIHSSVVAGRQADHKGVEGAETAQGSNWSKALNQLERRHLYESLLALQLLFENLPKLMGLMSSPSALAPVLACMDPGCQRGHLGELGNCPSGQTKEDAIMNDLAFDVALTELSLAILAKLIQNASCVSSLSVEAPITQALWLIHRPISFACLVIAIKVLLAVAGSPPAGWAAGCQGGALYLLDILVSEPDESLLASAPSKAAYEAMKAEVATLLGRLMGQQVHGRRVELLVSKILPPGLVGAVHDGPGDVVVTMLGLPVESPERIWSEKMLQLTADEVHSLAVRCRIQQATGDLEFSLPEGFTIDHDELRGELYVGGVYVRFFMKDPKTPLRRPKNFLEGLLELYVEELGKDTIKEDLVILLSATAVSLLKVHGLLADHAVNLGYLKKLIRLLSRRVPKSTPQHNRIALVEPDEIGGTILRLVHQLVTSVSAGEALSTAQPPSMRVLICAMSWGVAGSVLALESIKRCLFPTNRSRDILVEQALHSGLVELLLSLLDWHKVETRQDNSSEGHTQERDLAVQRVLAVDVLKLMAEDGLHGMTVEEILSASDVWQAYKHQKHDLFLPSGATAESGVVGLLEGSTVARFALPAPETNR